MRFAIIILISSLLVPAWGTSMHQRRSSPSHGKFVSYLADHGGQQSGIVVGKPSAGGNYKVAPVEMDGDEVGFYHHDRVVRVHPGDVADMSLHPRPDEASRISRSHRQSLPPATYIKRPAPGSPHYQAAESLMHIHGGGHFGAGFGGTDHHYQ